MQETCGGVRRETVVCAAFSKQPPDSKARDQLVKIFLILMVRVKLIKYIPIRPRITNNTKLKQEKTQCLPCVLIRASKMRTKCPF